MKSEHAIVMGASMSGLLAARVLSKHFQRVTLMERDALPSGVENRRGVPQGRHTHGLLASGLRVLEQLFPDFTKQATEEGALPGDVVRDVCWFFEEGNLAQPTSGLNGLLASRPLLENLVRRRVLALPNLALEQDCQVDGLLATPDRDRITGVSCKSGAVSADLVVDCTGRGSKTPQWLETLGYLKPAEERVQVAIAYTTRWFRRQPHQLNGKFGAIVGPTPTGKRGGAMLLQEPGDRWTCTLFGHFGNQAPEDVPGFLEYASTLPSPEIYQTIRDAEPISEASSTRFPHHQRRRYEKLKRFPAGFLVMGDGICSFNPIYGQGMSVAAQEAMELDALLAESQQDFALRFFERIASVVDIPWSIAVGSDLRIKETVGPRSTATTIINGYIARLQRAAHNDPMLSVAFHNVANLLAPPPTLLHPKMMLRILRANWNAPKAASSQAHSQTA